MFIHACIFRSVLHSTHAQKALYVNWVEKLTKQ